MHTYRQPCIANFMTTPMSGPSPAINLSHNLCAIPAPVRQPCRRANMQAARTNVDVMVLYPSLVAGSPAKRSCRAIAALPPAEVSSTPLNQAAARASGRPCPSCDNRLRQTSGGTHNRIVCLCLEFRAEDCPVRRLRTAFHRGITNSIRVRQGSIIRALQI